MYSFNIERHIIQKIKNKYFYKSTRVSSKLLKADTAEIYKKLIEVYRLDMFANANIVHVGDALINIFVKLCKNTCFLFSE
jgi:hypothetical protein